MFRKNESHFQQDMFSIYDSLPESTQKEVRKSKEYHFYHIMFCHIVEDRFALLYSDKKSRPNAPVNAMIAALYLKDHYTWTYEQLFKEIKFNLLTKIALGLKDISEIPFCQASLFNFQNRLNKHFIETGENLMEHVFDHLTADQIKRLKLKTDIQRTDSFAAASNIRNYSRLQLLIEMIIRIHRLLSDNEKEQFHQQFDTYVKQTSGQYIYSLKVSDLPHELEKVGLLFQWIYQNLYPKYQEIQIFKIFKRVYEEHFTIVSDKITVKSHDQLSSSSIQSPDDIDAAYRNKNGKRTKGQSINVVETANTDNPVNLVTDVSVNPVNTDDGNALNKRIDIVKKKTPDLNELHMDGGFGNSDNDKLFELNNIKAVQTAIKGRQAAVAIDIEQISDTEYRVSCPFQTVSSTFARKRHKAEFDLTICENCALCSKCPSKAMKKYRVFYFTEEHYLCLKRQKTIHSIPESRQKLRNNVEATVHEFTCRMPQKKLKVRGAFKAALFAFSVSAMVNFGRIYRYILANPDFLCRFLLFLSQCIKERVIFIRLNVNFVRFINFTMSTGQFCPVLKFSF